VPHARVFASSWAGTQWVRSSISDSFPSPTVPTLTYCFSQQPTQLDSTNAQIVSFASSRSGVRVTLLAVAAWQSGASGTGKSIRQETSEDLAVRHTD
jgi:hypothetical protein